MDFWPITRLLKSKPHADVLSPVCATHAGYGGRSPGEHGHHHVHHKVVHALSPVVPTHHQLAQGGQPKHSIRLEYLVFWCRIYMY